MSLKTSIPLFILTNILMKALFTQGLVIQTVMNQKKIAYLEHAEAALPLASDLGAISTAVMSVVKTGDHIIFGDVIYECIFALFTKILTKLVITYTRVDTSISENVGAAIQPNTSLIYIKTQSNPTLKLSDIKKNKYYCSFS